MVRPLRLEDGALLVLDQRRLPAEETWLRCERPEQVAEAIRTLAVRGAPAIGLAAAYGVALAGDDGADATPAELVDAIFTEAGVLEPPYPDSIAAALGGR